MPNIFIHDEFDPEAMAMMQALYSRSSESVKNHIEKVREKGTAKFMESYYVGYGHASIGDCGSTTLFIEELSILAAKAIQDNPLYSGQESSTRYIDFSKQPLIDPVGTAQSQKIQRDWLDFYLASVPLLVSALKEQFPQPPDAKERVWESAIKARAFDILRGFLPAGITTQLAWSTNFRQAHDRIKLLRHHPLAEVRDIAEQCLVQLKEKYPSSFGHKFYPDQEEYLRKTAMETNYIVHRKADGPCDRFTYKTTIDNKALEAGALEAIKSRPQKTALPRNLGKYGRYVCTFPLDYGSFRDLQRHRNGLCPIPLLNEALGFHDWYLDMLPPALRAEAENLIARQMKDVAALAATGVSETDLQYYFPLGMKVKCELDYDLPQMVYVTELRSGTTVHATLREITHDMHAAMAHEHPNLKLYTSLEPDQWDIRRGEHDIVERKAL
jgi:thymidylate synthase ThyX